MFCAPTISVCARWLFSSFLWTQIDGWHDSDGGLVRGNVNLVYSCVENRKNIRGRLVNQIEM